MKHKNVFIFDYDGTILNSFPFSQKIIQVLAKKFNVSLPDINSREFKKIWGRNGYQMVKLCFSGCNTREVYQEWKNLEHSMKISLIGGIEKTVKKIKENGDITGILTNRTWQSLRKYKKLWKPLKFDFIQTSEYELKQQSKRSKNHLITTNFKPDFRCFRPVFEWLIWKKQIEPKKIFYIGDCMVDFEAVNNASCFYDCEFEFIGVLTGPIKTRREWYETMSSNKRFLILRSVADLPEWLEDREKENKFSFKLFRKE